MSWLNFVQRIQPTRFKTKDSKLEELVIISSEVVWKRKLESSIDLK